jgi:hypothetical protein
LVRPRHPSARPPSVHRSLLIGGDGVRVEGFLAQPVAHWVAR